MRPTFLLTGLSFLAIAAPAFATTAEPIVITATRSPQPLSRVGQTISVIDQTVIANRQADTVIDLLRDVPGVTFTRNGGVGAVTSLFIRGAESDQTVALIDGVKLNDPSAPGGGFNFGDLLVGNIDRIEVLRGPSSVLWGSQAIGGVVNIITAPPSDTLHLNARAELGYRGTRQLVGNVSGKAGPLSASIGAGTFRTAGISAFSERRGGTERDGYRNHGANANLNLALSDAVSVDLKGWLSNGRSAIDGFAPPDYNFGDTREVGHSRQVVGYAGLNAALFNGRLHNRIGFAVTDTRRRNTDPDSLPVETFAGVGRDQRIEYQGIADLADHLQATFGAERETSRFTASSYGGPATRGRAQIDSFYAQLVASPLAGLTVVGGVRHDRHDRFGSAATVAASAAWTPNAGATTLRASYSEGFKAPSLYQLQSEYGNATLRPERSRGWDAAVSQRFAGGVVEASATVFHRASRDLITFISCPFGGDGICTDRPYGTYDNVAKARARGVELTLKLRPVEPLTIQANMSVIDVRNRTPGDAEFGKRLARRPSQSANLSIDYRWPFRLETGATVRRVSHSFDDPANSARVAGYTLADIRVSYPVSKDVSVFGRVENLFDERYETVRFYGTTGRAVYVGSRLRL